MKRFIFLLTTIFICTIAYAHTINWHVGDTILETTTCDSGDSITPPTAPYKYGYHLKEWEVLFTRIEYLESTGTQWIDTGFKPNQNTGIKTKIQINDISEGAPICFGNNSSYEFFIYSRETIFNYSKLYYGSKNIQNNDIFEIDWNKNHFNYKQNDVQQQEIIGNNITFSSGSNLYIFALARPSSNNTPYYKGNIKIYYFQIYDDDVLIRDFIPVLDGNGVPCMYDKVEGKFYYNAGTGQFVAGPVIGE